MNNTTCDSVSTSLFAAVSMCEVSWVRLEQHISVCMKAQKEDELWDGEDTQNAYEEDEFLAKQALRMPECVSHCSGEYYYSYCEKDNNIFATKINACPGEKHFTPEMYNEGFGYVMYEKCSAYKKSISDCYDNKDSFNNDWMILGNCIPSKAWYNKEVRHEVLLGGRVVTTNLYK